MKLVVVLQDVFVFSWGQTIMKPIADVSEISIRQLPAFREVSEIDKFIDKAKQNIDTAIFTINMIEMQLSEVADFLEMFVPELIYQNQFRASP